MTPAGTSNELDVQNEWEENTHTHTQYRTRYNAGMYQAKNTDIIAGTGRPGSSEVPRNPLIRWDVSSIPANGIFLTKKLKKQTKNAQRVEND